MAQEGSSTETAANPLGLALGFVEGVALVTLQDRPLGPGVTLRALELELAEVEFPLDLKGGAEEFQRRSTQLVHLVLDVALDRLAAALEQAAAELGRPLTHLRLVPDGARIALEAEMAGAPVAADVLCGSAPDGGLEVHVGAPIPFGPSSEPPARLSLDLADAVAHALSRVGPRGAESVALRGPGAFTFDPVAALLWALMPTHGWKVPRRDGVSVAGAALAEGALRLVVGASKAGYVPPSAEPMGEAALLAARAREDEARLGPDVGAALARGALPEAFAALSGDGEAAPSEARLERLIGIGLGAPALHPEVADLAKDRLQADPEHALARLALATIAQQDGDAAAARGHFEKAARGLRRLGRRRRAGLAYRAAAGQAAGDKERARLLEETIALRPDDVPALAGLVEALPGLGRASAAVRAARRLANLAPDAATKARAHRIAGQLLFEAVEDPVGAKREFERALKAAPDDPEALEGLARAVTQQGEPRRAATILERLLAQAERAGDHARASRLNVRLGDLWRPLDHEAAEARYRRAHELRPDAAGPLLALVETARSVGRAEAAIEALDDAAPALDRLQDPAEGSSLRTLRLLAGELYAASADRDADAVAQYEAALELAPDHEGALEALTELHARRGDAVARAETLSRRARAAVAAGDVDRAVALWRVGWADGAWRASPADLKTDLRGALEANRSHRGLLDLWVELGRAEGPDALVEALDRRLLLDDPTEVREGLWTELGEAFEAAGRPADAIRAYEEAGLAPAPVHRLIALYRARADAPRLADALGRAAELDDDAAQRAALHAERATVLAEHGDEDQAWVAMQVALQYSPEDPQLLPVATKLALRNGDPTTARRLVDRRLAAADDAAARRGAYVDLARISEVLGDREGVAQALSQAYAETEAGTPQGLSLAGRLAAELAAQERWAELAALQRRRAAVPDRPVAEQAARHLDAARLLAQLEDPAAEAEIEAVFARAEEGAVDPETVDGALEVQDALAERAGDALGRARVRARRAARTRGPEADRLRLEAADLFTEADDPDAAIRALEAAGPAPSRAVAARLGALCAGKGDVRAAATAFARAAAQAEEEQDADAARDLHAEAAAAFAAAGDAAEALVHDRRVLAVADAPPDGVLDRLEAHARVDEDPALLAEVLGRRAEGAAPDLAAGFLVEKASLHFETPGQDPDGLRALRRAHEIAPPDAEIADVVDTHLEQALERVGLYAEQAAVLSAWAERTPAGPARAERLHRAAEVYATRLRDRSMALSRAQAAVRADPGHAEARTLRISLLRAEGRIDALAEALSEEAARSDDAREASRRWLEAAELLAPPRHIDDAGTQALSRALAFARRAATAAPGEAGPLEAEIAYSRALGRSDEELSAIGRLVDRTEGGQARAALALRRAHLLRDALGDDLAAYAELGAGMTEIDALPEEAREDLVKALPDDTREALGIRGAAELDLGLAQAAMDLTERVEDWPAHLGLIGRVVELSSDPETRARLLVRAGEVREWRLGDGEGAEREYRTALATDPDHNDARRALSQFYVAVDRFGDLAESLGVEALVEVFEGFTDADPANRRVAAAQALWPNLAEGSSERADVQLRLSDLLERLESEEDYVHILEQVVKTGPGTHQDEALTRLRRFFDQHGRDDLYCDVLRRQAERIDTDEARAKVRAQLGEALEWRMGDGQGAEREYRAALAADPNCAPARHRLAELLSSQDRFEDIGRDLGADSLRDAVDGLLAQGSRDRERAFAAAAALGDVLDEAGRADLWLHVANVLETGPEDETARVREALEAAAEVTPRRDETLVRLSALLDRVGDHVDLAVVLARRAELTEDRAERAQLKLRQAELLLGLHASESAGADLETAEAALRAVLDVDGDQPVARAALTRLLGEQGRWVALAEVLGPPALDAPEAAAVDADDRARLRAILEARAATASGEARAAPLLRLVELVDAPDPAAVEDVPRDAEGLYRAALEAAPDHSAAKEGLRALLESEARFRDIGEQVSVDALRETVRGLERLDDGAHLLPATLALATVLAEREGTERERARLWVKAAALHQAEEDEDAAEHALRSALEVDPEHVVARDELRDLLVRQDRLEALGDVDERMLAQAAVEASQRKDRALEVRALRVLAGRREGRARADTWVLVAALEKERGDAAAEEAALIAALDTDPEHALAANELEAMLWGEGRQAEALARFSEARFVARARGLAEDDPSAFAALVEAMEADLSPAARARLLELYATVRVPTEAANDAWSRRALALDRAKRLWDELEDREGQLRARLALVDMLRARDDVDALLDALAEASPFADAPEVRAALAVERATLHALTDRPDAARALVEPLVDDARLPIAHRRGAARILVEDLLPDDLAALPLADLELRGLALETLTTGGEDEPEADRWLTELAGVREAMGLDATRIAEPLEAALARTVDAEAASRLRRRLQELYEELGDWRRAEAHAAALAEEADAPEAWVQVSELRAWLDDRKGAEAALARALARDPAHEATHSSLLRLAEQSGDTDSVIARLEGWVDAGAGADPEASVQRLLRAARLAAGERDGARAARLADRAMALAPPGSIVEVAEEATEILAPLGEAEARVALLTRAVSGSRAPTRVRLELADLLVDLDRPEEAWTVVAGGIERDTPADDPLVERAVQDAAEEPEDRAARRLLTLAERLKVGPAARRLFELAAAKAEAAGDAALARTGWSSLLSEAGAGDRAEVARAALLRLARAEDDAEALLAALVESAEDLSAPAEQAARLAEAADVADRSLDAPNRAEALFARARALAPEDEGLSDAYVAFARRRARWLEVDAALAARAARADGARRAELCRERAELAQDELHDPGAAARLWAEAFEAAPSPAAGRRAAAALAEAGDAAAALALLESVEVPDADPERGPIARQLAALLEAVGRVDEAAAVLEREVAANPGAALLQERFGSLLARHQRYEALADFLTRTAEDMEPGDGLKSLLAAARLRVERLDDPAGARRALQAGLTLVEGWLGAPGAPIPEPIAPPPAPPGSDPERAIFDAPLLELATLADELGAPELRVRALRLYAQSLPEGQAQWRVLLRLGSAEQEAGDLGAAAFTLRGVVEAIRDAEVDFEDRVEAERALGGLLLERGELADAIAALERAAALLEAHEVGVDEERADLLVRVSRAHLEAGDPEAALAAISKARLLAPDRVPRESLDAAVGAAGPSAQKAELAVRAAEETLLPSERAARLRAAAAVFEQIGAPERAFGPLLAAYDADPSNSAEAARLEDLLYEAERWSGLERLMARRLEVEDLTDEARGTLLAARARVLETQLGEPRRALSLWEEAAALEARPEVLRELARLAGAVGRTGVEQEALARLAAAASDPDLRREALLARARSLEKAGTLAGAAPCLEEALEVSLEHGLPVSAIGRALDAIYAKRREPASRARLWVRVAGVHDGPAAATAFARAGQVRLEILEDRRGAAAAYEAACRAAPEDLGLRRAALSIAEALGDKSRAELHAKAGAEAAAGQARLAARVSFLRAQARALAGLGRADEELAVWRTVLSLRPSAAALDDLVARAREGLSAAAVDEALAAALEADVTDEVRARLLMARARILDDPLGRHWEAEAAREDASRLDGGATQTLDIELPDPSASWTDQDYRSRRSMLDRSGRWSELADLEEAQAARVGSRAGRARSLLDVARTHHSAKTDDARARALDALGRAVALDPGLVEAHALRLRLQVAVEDWAGALASVDALDELGGPPWPVPELELTAARVADAVGEPERAMAALFRALERDPQDEPARARLARLEPTEARLSAWAEVLDPVLDAAKLGEVGVARARLALEAGDLAGALTEADAAVRADPHRLEARTVRREALEAQGAVAPLVDALSEEAALQSAPTRSALRMRALDLAEADDLRARAQEIAEDLARDRDDDAVRARLVAFWRGVGDSAGWVRALDLAGGAPSDLDEAGRAALAAGLWRADRPAEAWTVLADGLPALADEPGWRDDDGAVARVNRRLARALAIEAELDPETTDDLRGAGMRLRLDAHLSEAGGEDALRVLRAAYAALPEARALGRQLAAGLVAAGARDAAASLYRSFCVAAPGHRADVDALVAALPAEAARGARALRSWLQEGGVSQADLPIRSTPLAAEDWVRLGPPTPLMEALRLGGRALARIIPPGFEPPAEPRSAEDDPRAAGPWSDVRAVLPGAFRAYVNPDGGCSIRLETGEAPGLAIGEGLLETASPLELRFRLARAAALIELGFLLAAWVPGPARGEHLTRLADAAEGDGDALGLSEAVRARLSELTPHVRGATELDLGYWRLDAMRVANRLALWVTGDLAVAVRALDALEPRAVAEPRGTPDARARAARRWGPIADLCAWLVSEDHADALWAAGA